MKNKDFMRTAVQESEINITANEGGPFGAVIVKDDRIVGKGHNQVLMKHDPTCHAEIRDACSNLGSHDLSGCVLYTSCYPCPMCLSAAIWANIKSIVYGNTAEEAAAIGFRDDYIYDFIRDDCENSEVAVLTQTEHEHTIKVFDDFMKKKDRTVY